FFLAEEIEHLLDLPLGDHLSKANLLRIVDGNHQGEVPMGEAELEIGPPLPENLPFHKVFDYGRSMMRIDDLVSLGEHKTPSCARVASLRKQKDNTTAGPAATQKRWSRGIWRRRA